ncbi:MAG: hypothetical protein AAFX50_06485, partial [Acidobacteriota bacterium]
MGRTGVKAGLEMATKNENPRVGPEARGGDAPVPDAGRPAAGAGARGADARLESAADTRTLGTASVEPAESIVGVTPGQVLADRFTIVRLLGSGGMGAVFEADDSVLHEPVALKVVRARAEGSDQELLRLRREVQLARRVTHRNVCRMYD